MKKIAMTLLVVFILTACDDDDDHQSVSFDGEYFPLHVGDSWEYVAYDWQHKPTRVMKREITTIVTINNQQYYLMKSRSASDHGVYIDTTYYRIDHKEYVYERKNDQDHEINPFRLAAEDGTSWKDASYISAEGLMALHQFTTVNLDQTAVDSCKVFSYDAENIEDEESYVTLGPGLGIVKEGSYVWGWRFELKKAVVNGETFVF